jgi:bifunctional non-homologous end joining protein LigD
VCLDHNGRPRFYDLMFQRADPVYAAFDLLWLNGEDLRQIPLAARKRKLQRLIPKNSADVLYVDHVESNGGGLYDQVCQHGLEGIVAKPKGSPYADNSRDNIPSYPNHMFEPSPSEIGVAVLLIQ